MGILCEILSVPQNMVMDSSNVMHLDVNNFILNFFGDLSRFNISYQGFTISALKAQGHSKFSMPRASYTIEHTL